MNSNKIEYSSCGEVYEGNEIENCLGCGEDFCDNCLNNDDYCSDCE